MNLLGGVKPTSQRAAYRFGDVEVSLDLLLSIDDFYSLWELRPELVDASLTLLDLGAFAGSNLLFASLCALTLARDPG